MSESNQKADIMAMSGVCMYNEIYALDKIAESDFRLMYGFGSDKAIDKVPPLPGSAMSALRASGFRRVAQGPCDLQVVGSVDGSLPIPSGIVMVVGPADVGKTPLAMHIAERTGGLLIRHGEPFPRYTITREELAMQILEAAQHTNVIVVDSLKDLARDSTGAAMSDGLNSGFFTMMSQWSSLFASYGKSLIVPVNFATTRSDAVSSALQSIRSNATMLIESVEDGCWDWVMRTAVGAKRTSGKFRVKWKANEPGVQNLVDVGKAGGNSKNIREFASHEIGVFVTANPDAMQTSIRRASSKK